MLVFFFFFFFNDTATTEIYTLSLHDALPILIAVLVLFTALALPLQLAAQHIRYKLIDIPTLGGPAAYGNVDNAGFAQFINNPGVVVGGADSSIHDPNAPNCGNADCFLTHAFRWQDGVLTDL